MEKIFGFAITDFTSDRHFFPFFFSFFPPQMKAYLFSVGIYVYCVLEERCGRRDK